MVTIDKICRLIRFPPTKVSFAKKNTSKKVINHSSHGYDENMDKTLPGKKLSYRLFINICIPFFPHLLSQHLFWVNAQNFGYKIFFNFSTLKHLILTPFRSLSQFTTIIITMTSTPQLSGCVSRQRDTKLLSIVYRKTIKDEPYHHILLKTATQENNDSVIGFKSVWMNRLLLHKCYSYHQQI